MTSETKTYIRDFANEVLNVTDFLKTLDLDQFTIMRIALIHSIADQIYDHLEV